MPKIGLHVPQTNQLPVAELSKMGCDEQNALTEVL